MREYNDYILMTKEYLKRYKQFLATQDNLADEIDTLQKLIDTESVAPIAKYGENVGGGTPELNSVELAVARKSDTEQKLTEAQRNIANLQLMLRKIDRAVKTLPTEDQEIIREHYYQGKSWMTIGYNRKYSEQWARKKGRQALNDIAFVLFGSKVKPENLSFVFSR